MTKPWAGEFPVDGPEGMDEAAQRILARNMKAGRDDLFERVSIEEYDRDADFVEEPGEAVAKPLPGCCTEYSWGTTVVPEGTDPDDVPF
jgi:hypothetical protein